MPARKEWQENFFAMSPRESVRSPLIILANRDLVIGLESRSVKAGSLGDRWEVLALYFL